MKAMIFAAGLGTRLKPITDTMPKALLPIGGKPLLMWQLECLRKAQISEVVVNVHHFAEQIEQYVADLKKEACGTDWHIRFSDERAMLLETGGGLRKAGTLLGEDEPVLVMNVDVLSNIDIPALVASHRTEDLATIVVSERETQRYLLFDDEMILRGWTNIKTGEVKPAGLQTEGLHRLAFSGMHVVSPRIFARMQEWPEKFSIIDFYVQACQTETIRAYIPQNYRMMDIGKIDGLEDAERFAKSL